MASFEKGAFVRNIVHFRKHVKYSQLYTVDSSYTDPTGNEWLTLTHILYGQTHRNMPAENMQAVSQNAIDKIFDVSKKSVSVV